ncbi:unnamed protein product [Paramecium pentaurelia]|uniref:Uncharacterized protein n=1 Tax=Paramecium pentaurelia TaxID=43138 RepID=A0A8S1VRA8_9CILI|nr:unnamed protein product [Paramecium pentaurelia]
MVHIDLKYSFHTYPIKKVVAADQINLQKFLTTVKGQTRLVNYIPNQLDQEVQESKINKLKKNLKTTQQLYFNFYLRDHHLAIFKLLIYNKAEAVGFIKSKCRENYRINSTQRLESFNINLIFSIKFNMINGMRKNSQIYLIYWFFYWQPKIGYFANHGHIQIIMRFLYYFKVALILSVPSISGELPALKAQIMAYTNLLFLNYLKFRPQDVESQFAQILIVIRQQIKIVLKKCHSYQVLLFYQLQYSLLIEYLISQKERQNGMIPSQLKKGLARNLLNYDCSLIKGIDQIYGLPTETTSIIQ